MADNASKIEYFGKVLIDLTGDNVTPEKMVTGTTAHDKSGAQIKGANPYEKTATDTEISTQAAKIAELSALLDGKMGGGSGSGSSEIKTYSMTIQVMNSCRITEILIPKKRSWNGGEIYYDTVYAIDGDYTCDGVVVGYPVILQILCSWEAYVQDSDGFDFVQDNHTNNNDYILINSSGAPSATIVINESD